MTDTLAARIPAPEGAEFTEAEQALLRALPLLTAEAADRGISILREHFDVPEDRGEVGQIIHAYGFYRGIHSTMAALGAEILDETGKPLSQRPGFGVVTMDDGTFKPRSEFKIP